MFRKRATCPSSHELLAYHRSDSARQDDARIRTHLRVCDFCNAELQLLIRYRADLEEATLVEMPAPLRRLAERWLSRSAAAFNELSELVSNRRLSH
jgi:hypothetical protein